MPFGFSTRKLRSGACLSERFKSARRQRNLSLLDCEAGTKVRAKFLSALEEAKWEVLPQEVYSRGFVLAYSRFLKLDAEAMLILFDREMASRRRENKNLSYKRTFNETKFIVTPKFLAYAFLILFSVMMFSYITYEVSGFAGQPALRILSPQNNIILENEALEVAGVTDIDTAVSVNNENVPVGSDGHFVQALRLHRGVNVISVKAVNKAKRESAEVYTVEYRPKTAGVVTELNY